MRCLVQVCKCVGLTCKCCTTAVWHSCGGGVTAAAAVVVAHMSCKPVLLVSLACLPFAFKDETCFCCTVLQHIILLHVRVILHDQCATADWLVTLSSASHTCGRLVPSSSNNIATGSLMLPMSQLPRSSASLLPASDSRGMHV